MPELPNLTQVAAAPEQASGVRIAAPSMSGLRSVAQGLGAIGDEMQQARMRQLEYQTKMDVLQTENDYATFMEKKKLKLDVNNPLGWEESMRAASGEWKENELANKTISPAARKQLDLRLAQQEGAILRTTMRDAELSQVRMLNTLFKTRQEQYLDTGDYEGALANLDDLRSGLKLNSAEYDAQRNAILKHQKMADYKSIALSGNVDYFDTPKADLTQAQTYTLQRLAKTAAGQLQKDQQDAATDAIYSGRVETAEEIYNMTSLLNAKVQEKLVGEWMDINNAEKQKRLRDPEFQKQIEGELNVLLGAYKKKAITTDANGLDEPYRDVSRLVNLIADEEKQKQYRALLEEAVAGKKAELKTTEDFGAKMVEEAANIMFPEPDDDDVSGPALQSYLDDGFLMNRDKLLKVGFSEDQADKIVEAAEKDDEALRDPKKTVTHEAVNLVRALWKESSQRSEDLSERDWRIFLEIKNYGTKTTPIADPKEVAAFKREYEKQRKQWFRGKAIFIGETLDQINNYIKEIRATEGRNPTKDELADFLNIDSGFKKARAAQEQFTAGEKPTL